MNSYNPTTIQRLASILGTVATITLVLFGLSGLATGVIAVVLASQLGNSGGSLALFGGVVYGALIFGIGYLVSLVIRVIAQLMLALVQIEANTRQVGVTLPVTASPSSREVRGGAADQSPVIPFSSTVRFSYQTWKQDSSEANLVDFLGALKSELVNSRLSRDDVRGAFPAAAGQVDFEALLQKVG